MSKSKESYLVGDKWVDVPVDEKKSRHHVLFEFACALKEMAFDDPFISTEDVMFINEIEFQALDNALNKSCSALDKKANEVEFQRKICASLYAKHSTLEAAINSIQYFRNTLTEYTVNVLEARITQWFNFYQNQSK